MTGDFQHISDELVTEGVVVSFYRSTFRDPNGASFVRDVVRHPGAVSVVPVTDDGNVVMVHQFRAPVNRYLLEIPAGKRDVAGEDPVLTAERELAEEVGYQASTFTYLVPMAQSPGFCDEINHIYLATGLVPVERDVQGIEEEHMTIELIPLTEIRSRIVAGDIVDSKTLVGLLLALDHLGVAPS